MLKEKLLAEEINDTLVILPLGTRWYKSFVNNILYDTTSGLWWKHKYYLAVQIRYPLLAKTHKKA